MAIKTDVVNTGDYIDDPNSDDAYTAFSNINEAFKSIVPETGLPIVDGGTGATTIAAARANLGLNKFAQNPGYNTAMIAPNVDAAIVISDTGWGIHKGNEPNFFAALQIDSGGTGATTVEQARINLGLTSIQLPAGTNLNNVQTPGTYYCDANVDATTMLNIPIATSFVLKVDKTAGVIQEFTTYADSGSRRFIRGMYSDWSAWEEVIKGHKRLNFSNAEQTGILSPNTGAGIYMHDNGNPFLWNGTAPTAPRWSVFDGGTGGKSEAEARTNLGLGTAATRNVGATVGNLLEVGSFGVGASGSRVSPNSALDYVKTYFGKSQFCGTDIGVNSNLPNYSAGFFSSVANTYSFIVVSPFSGEIIALSGLDPDSSTEVLRTVVKTDRNTTVDGNGFVKAASPIVKLFADKIELNDEAKLQEIVFEKVGTGGYLIKGSTGLAQDGWYIEQPKDTNGNIYHAIEYGTHDNGDIWVKTYEQMMSGTRIVADHTKPIDIKENRFISVRLNELPKDTTAPINPTVKDNEGNAAPSRLHELVDGVWIVSDENAAILEQERLAAMPALKRRQFRLTLAMNGYDLKEIETLIDQIEDPMQRTIAQIEWQDATDFERTNPTLLMMAQLLGLSSEDVDSLWEYGLAL